jgi:hypothetical protein
MNERYRAISWWLTWEDMMWPNQAIVDKIRRRADQAAEASVNCAMIFGMHFRWDHMPLWDRLHDLLAYTVEQLHARKILVFDHHSSVLVHRPRTREDAWDIDRRNRHHVPLYPSVDTAATWTVDGHPINEWRMIDVETGQPAYLPTYTAEQFCMNNPHFRLAYQDYLRKLIRETGIDGLMSDDNVHYGGWRTCGCRWCRAHFLNDYGHELPAVSDLRFWGNRDSEAFKDWIEMRFQDSGGFLGYVKAALPEGFPLLSCCSTSDYAAAPSSGITYQEYIKHCNIVMLEMGGNTPTLNGTWSGQMASQMLHLAIARDSASPCLGLGYGFFPDTGFFVWALNKLLGADAWFSTLPGRLAGPPVEIERLADDPELVAEGFGWEKANQGLFAAQADANLAVFFSRATRDYYGQTHQDYTLNYHLTCSALVGASIDFEVVTAIPNASQWPVLVLSSAICLSQEEIASLELYLHNGGIIVAAGPTGLRDQRARPWQNPWLAQYGIRMVVEEPERRPSFPPYIHQEGWAARCTGLMNEEQIDPAGWIALKIGAGQLHWSAGRVQSEVEAVQLSAMIAGILPPKSPHLLKTPAGWTLRRYKDSEHSYLVGLPKSVAVFPHAAITNAFTKEGIVERIEYSPLDPEALMIQLEHAPASVKVYSPDLPEPRELKWSDVLAGEPFSIDLSGIRRFFVIQIKGS